MSFGAGGSWEISHPAIMRGGRVVLAAGGIVLPGGAVIGLVGANGAGKSTLLMHCAHVLAQPHGSAGEEYAVVPVGYAPQHPTLPSWLGGVGIARLFGQDFDRVAEDAAALHLAELREVRGGRMSPGQTQALSIALALAAPAPLVLLDEPFAPLDFRRRAGLAQTLRSDRSVRRAVVITSQSASELMDVCSWIVILRDGSYVYNGPLATLSGTAVRGEAARRELEDRILALL